MKQSGEAKKTDNGGEGWVSYGSKFLILREKKKAWVKRFTTVITSCGFFKSVKK